MKKRGAERRVRGEVLRDSNTSEATDERAPVLRKVGADDALRGRGVIKRVGVADDADVSGIIEEDQRSKLGLLVFGLSLIHI